MQKSVSSTAAVMRHHVLTDAILFGSFAGKAISEPVAKAFLIVVGSLLLAVSAQIKIPFYPVPVTGQTLVVLLIGMTYGPRLGGATIAASFTVRKISFGEGVERVFPLYSTNIDTIEVVRRGKVRRAKLYYLRSRRGKSARIAENTTYKAKSE